MGIRTIATTGGEPREFFQMSQPTLFQDVFVWTPDGRHLLFDKHGAGVVSLISDEGTELKTLDFRAEAHLTFHPDGRRVAFTSERMAQELWVMEDFLPPLEGSQ